MKKDPDRTIVMERILDDYDDEGDDDEDEKVGWRIPGETLIHYPSLGPDEANNPGYIQAHVNGLLSCTLFHEKAQEPNYHYFKSGFTEKNTPTKEFDVVMNFNNPDAGPKSFRTIYKISLPENVSEGSLIGFSGNEIPAKFYSPIIMKVMKKTDDNIFLELDREIFRGAYEAFIKLSFYVIDGNQHTQIINFCGDAYALDLKCLNEKKAETFQAPLFVRLKNGRLFGTDVEEFTINSSHTPDDVFILRRNTYYRGTRKNEVKLKFASIETRDDKTVCFATIDEDTGDQLSLVGFTHIKES
ncbi:MAG: hypothetical protein NTZ80_01935 [Patescibacteria group bacterium]|nr:hypothetical protein [Patescibacteria group bacterium]